LCSGPEPITYWGWQSKLLSSGEQEEIEAIGETLTATDPITVSLPGLTAPVVSDIVVVVVVVVKVVMVVINLIPLLG